MGQSSGTPAVCPQSVGCCPVFRHVRRQRHLEFRRAKFKCRRIIWNLFEKVNVLQTGESGGRQTKTQRSSHT